MSRFSISFKINRDQKPGTDLDKKLQRLRADMAADIEGAGKLAAVKALRDNQAEIVQDIRADLEQFGAKVARFFTTIKSPLTPKPLSRRERNDAAFGRLKVTRKPASSLVTINLNRELLADSNILRTNIGPDRSKNPNAAPRTLTWQALSYQTLRNKRRRGSRASTFFVDTGQLRQTLIAGLGPAYADLVNPQIEFTEGVGSDGKPEGQIKVKALLNQAFRSSLLTSFANTGEGAKSEKLMLRYLKIASAERALAKLSNADASHQGPYRPFVQPALAFWVLNSLPNVFRASVQKAVKKKRARIRGSHALGAQGSGH